jgi:DNA-binding response OmpR family regulator
VPDVLVIDIGLPDADGRDLCQALRARGVQTPVLFLTARDAVVDRISGFDAGGDDYLTKPFAFVELVARLQALLRRSGSDGALESGGPARPAHPFPRRREVGRAHDTDGVPAAREAVRGLRALFVAATSSGRVGRTARSFARTRSTRTSPAPAKLKQFDSAEISTVHGGYRLG